MPLQTSLARGAKALAIAAGLLVLHGLSLPVAAQRPTKEYRYQSPVPKPLPKQRPLPLPKIVKKPQPKVPEAAKGAVSAGAALTAMPLETVQADVSTRQVAVTSSFTGTEIVVFGAIDNSRQPTAEAGYYDVVVVLEGTKERLVARRKERVGGIWINTASQKFQEVPSYYAISSTRPLDEVAADDLLDDIGVGFSHVPIKQAPGKALPAAEFAKFRESVVRLKQANGLYISQATSVAFVGRSLFRTSVRLPANVTVGPFDTKVYLFREGKLLSKFTTRLTLEREGIERIMHAFAFGYPFWFGIFAVIVAVAAGLAAERIFGRSAH